MNVLYYLRQFPKLSERFVLDEIYELTRQGHTVAVFARNNPDEPIVHREFEELILCVVCRSARYAIRSREMSVTPDGDR